MDELTFFLLRKKAHKTPLRISTTELGIALGMSQQNASRLLILLENQGMIERKGNCISISKKGIEEARAVYAELKNTFESRGSSLIFSGAVVEGLHEGRYYISKYASRLEHALGFKSVLGTLNIKLDKKDIDKRTELTALDPIIIQGFREGERSFGDIFAYRCRIGQVDCAVILPVRTHHGTEILEIISDKNILRLCKKKMGDRVKVTIL